MDLVATVRKEGSRGGQGDFKWSDVQASSRREHYLGHSLMAPVGRWQKDRDLNWYAKGEKDEQDEEDPATKAARERKEEIKRIKEAEEDALARALGLPVVPRNNANEEPVSDKRAVDKAMNEAVGSDDHHAKGIGYGSQVGAKDKHVDRERIEGNAEEQDKELQYALKEYRRRHDRDNGPRRRNRSRSHERRHRHSERDLYHSQKDRPRDDRRRKSRSHSPDRDQDRERPRKRRDRSRSPRRSHNQDRRRY